MNTRKKKSVTKSKDVGFSSKSHKGKQAISNSFEFNFVKIADNDTIMIFLMYFLECNLLSKLNNISICREALLLTFNWDIFNSYPLGGMVSNLLFW